MPVSRARSQAFPQHVIQLAPYALLVSGAIGPRVWELENFFRQLDHLAQQKGDPLPRHAGTQPGHDHAAGT